MNQPRIPSPATLVAVLALVAALAGTAVAGPDASTSAINKKKVKKIAKKQINKLAPGLSVLKAENATNADQLDNLNSTDFRRSNQVIGASDLGTIRERSAISADIPPSDLGQAGRQCGPGEQVLSGGNDYSGTDAAVVASRFEPPNGWRVFLENNAAAGNANVTVRAYCLEP